MLSVSGSDFDEFVLYKSMSIITCARFGRTPIGQRPTDRRDPRSPPL